MTIVTVNELNRGTPGLLQRLIHRFSAFLDGIGEARAMAELYKSLSRMTDAQLAARGLKREDIPQAVLARFR